MRSALVHSGARDIPRFDRSPPSPADLIEDTVVCSKSVGLAGLAARRCYFAPVADVRFFPEEPPLPASLPFESDR